MRWTRTVKGTFLVSKKIYIPIFEAGTWGCRAQFDNIGVAEDIMAMYVCVSVFLIKNIFKSNVLVNFYLLQSAAVL